MRCFAGERAYFPAIERTYSASDIAQALARGMPVAKIAREVGISRRQVYRVLQASRSRE
ncbi:helix-turn-helix domain-containing protein [Xanthomonas prunicola]|uniref:helix-turn-helix domain-containing protein n=1 Tax=Xanthomonas prunicola TaxID=2053930 RepID=UPI003CCE4105